MIDITMGADMERRMPVGATIMLEKAEGTP